MRYEITVAFSICFLLCSCKDKIYEERINNRELIEGEYYSELRPKDGFSIRGNKIAFFENMVFVSKDIYEFVLIDSMLTDADGEEKIGSYIKRTDLSDTLYTQIDRKTDSIIILNPNVRPEAFKLKTRIIIK